MRTCTRTWQVRLFRAALRLPKYSGLGLAPDTTPVDMALLAWSQRRPGDGAGRRLASWGWLSPGSWLRCSLGTKGRAAQPPINGEAPTRP